MRKIVTPYQHHLRSEKQKKSNHVEFSPGDETIQKILQFAATYQVEKIPENHQIEYFLN
ncbi:MAG: hypothetical protein QM751_02015 [Paludibacteraceae bacterium]